MSLPKCFGALLGLAGAAVACNRPSASPAQARAAVPESEVVARIDGQPITRADLDKRLADRSAFVRARYTAPDKRRELLDSVVRFEVLAREAQSRGYDRDPEVVRLLKQRAVERMLATEVDEKMIAAPLPPAEMQRYYQEHAEDFRQAEAVRVDQILIKDPGQAKQVAALARSLPPGDAAGFHKLVAAHSEDASTKARGGDLTFLQRGSDLAPPEVIDAAFRAASAGAGVGQVAGPIGTKEGFHILRVTQRRAAFLRPFEEVEPLVRSRILDERRRAQIDALVADVRGRVKVEIFEDRLKEVKGGQMGQDALLETAPAPSEKKR